MPTRPQLPDPAQTCARGPRLYDPKGTVWVLLGTGTGTVSDRWLLCVIDGPVDRLSSMSSDCVDSSVTRECVATPTVIMIRVPHLSSQIYSSSHAPPPLLSPQLENRTRGCAIRVHIREIGIVHLSYNTMTFLLSPICTARDVIP